MRSVSFRSEAGVTAGVGARAAAWLALAAGYGLMLWQNLPGHLSVDSVIELHEGRFHVRETWGPGIFPFILGIFDRIAPGTALYVIVGALLLYGGWALLPQLRGRASWWFPLVAAAAVLTPNILIYQGIVWHDVLFANAAMAGFLCLAFADRDWQKPRRPWVRLALSVLLLAAAGLLRQNGIVVLAPAAAAVAWIARGGGRRRAAAWGGGWFLAVVAATAVLSVTALPQGPTFEKADAQGMRVLEIYDLAGGLARDPRLPLPHIAQVDAATAAALRATAPKFYSPQRVDFIDQVERLQHRLVRLPSRAIFGDWLDMVLHRPDLYLAHRIQAFRWVFATPVIDRCLPVYLGIDGPPQEMAELGLEKVWGDRDQRLYNYSTWFYDTPVMSHVAYAVLALALLILFVVRRGPADGPMAALQAAGLVFAASFFPVSLACDYRYLYFLDVAALTGLLYFAADPRLRGPERRAPPA
ncbi:hypothetical protein [Phenylobacterium sp.]|uniref:hypothetical protein n=1 Tax=Phenylobacterium sp. TaxID=1871053 RepID=UPI0026079269|nr:hypothetical protein [Phenylobacterium sp.]